MFFWKIKFFEKLKNPPNTFCSTECMQLEYCVYVVSIDGCEDIWEIYISKVNTSHYLIYAYLPNYTQQISMIGRDDILRRG